MRANCVAWSSLLAAIGPLGVGAVGDLREVEAEPVLAVGGELLVGGEARSGQVGLLGAISPTLWISPASTRTV